jgi:glyoxylase-like metal-dependent hydrolase (beta-lactamase superfamily II)
VTPPYAKGLHEVGDGVYAYLQPDGGWGWSNAGLVVDGDASLLVDTLFDLRLTGEMLGAMRAAAPAAETIDTLVNTHANGDHCFGNELVAGARIVASSAGAKEMDDAPPELLGSFVKAAPDLGEVGAYIESIFGPFEFDGITLTPPTETFDGELALTVGDRTMQLVELGPAHTRGDVIAYLPDERLVFTGDLLFHGGHPVVWAGPVSNWIAACDRIVALDAKTVVPGHGPVTDNGAVRNLKSYLEYLSVEARVRFDAGLTPIEAARDISLADYEAWGEAERIVVNLTTLYRDFGGDPPSDVVTMFTQMAELARSS